MEIDFVKDYAVKILVEETPKEQTEEKLNFFNHLFNNGLIDYQRLKKGCINHFYDSACKTNGGSDKSAVLDTAIEFDCTTKTIHNTIYKFRHIRLNF